MARRVLASSILCLLFSTAIATSPKCFYPNGKESTTDFACSSASGSVCCPFNWECLDNGLCYNPAANILGRYTCTDKNWQSEGCPGFCNTDPSRGGAEAVLICPDGRYCCDRNRLVGDCCNWPASNSTFFIKPQGNVFASVVSSGIAKPTSLPGPSVPPLQTPSSSAAPPPPPPPPPQSSSSTPTPTPTPSSSASPSSSSTPPSSANDPPPPTTISSQQRLTSTMETVSSGSDGPHTIFITTVITTHPSSAASSSAAAASAGGNKSSRTNVIVGCAVGIPAGLAAIGAALFFVARRRRDSSGPETPRTPLSVSSVVPSRRISRLMRRSSDDPSTVESMLHTDTMSEKYGPAAYPNSAGPADIDGYDDASPNESESWTTIGRVYQEHRRGSLDGPSFGITPPSPRFDPLRSHDPHMSWVSTSSANSMQAPQTMWRLSGESDHGGWGSGVGLAPPHRMSLGPGGLSPVHEEPGIDFSTGEPVPNNPPPQPTQATPGGRSIPFRPPSMHGGRR